jgi:hypothetical protein
MNGALAHSADADRSKLEDVSSYMISSDSDSGTNEPTMGNRH